MSSFPGLAADFRVRSRLPIKTTRAKVRTAERGNQMLLEPIRANVSSLFSCSSTLSDWVTCRRSVSVIFWSAENTGWTHDSKYWFLGRLLHFSCYDQLVQYLSLMLDLAWETWNDCVPHRLSESWRYYEEFSWAIQALVRAQFTDQVRRPAHIYVSMNESECQRIE